MMWRVDRSPAELESFQFPVPQAHADMFFNQFTLASVEADHGFKEDLPR
jgi:hypothetical protein